MTDELTQLDKLEEAARQLETDDDLERLGKLMKHKPVENPSE